MYLEPIERSRALVPYVERLGVPISVAVAQQPFGQKVHHDYVMPSKSLADIIKWLDPHLPRGFYKVGRVWVNDKLIPKEQWRNTYPAGLDYITVDMPLSGGGGNEGMKTIIAIIAAIALFALVAFIPSSVAITAAIGTTGAQVLAGAVGVVGSLLLGALFPPPSLPEPKEEKGVQAASISANTTGKYRPYPRVIGTYKVYPFINGGVLHDPNGLDERVEAVLTLAGPHRITDIRIDGVPIEQNENIQWEVREGFPDEPPLSLVTRQAFEQETNVTIDPVKYSPDDSNELEDQDDPEASLSHWTRVISAADGDEVWFTFVFPEGLMEERSWQQDERAVGLRMRMREIGTTDWIELPTWFVFASKDSPFRLTMKLIWDNEPDVDIDVETGSWRDPRWILTTRGFGGQQVWTTTGPPFGGSHLTHLTPAGTGAYETHSYFTPAGSAAGEYTEVDHVARTRWVSYVYLDSGVFPKGQYEFEFKQSQPVQVDYIDNPFAFLATDEDWYYNQGNDDDPGQDFFDHWIIGSPDLWGYLNDTDDTTHGFLFPIRNNHFKCTIQRVATVWNSDPCPTKDMAKIAIIATNQSVQALSVLASGYIHDYNPVTGVWDVLGISSNPAVNYHNVLVGSWKLNPEPLALEEIGETRILDWKDSCDMNGYEVNMILEDASVWSALQLIAGVGIAVTRQSDLWEVVHETDRTSESPTQIWSPRNSANFTWEKAFPDELHGLLVTYNNRDEDYRETEILVLAPDYTEETATRIESVKYEGIVTTNHAELRALIDIRQSLYRGVFYSIDVSAASLKTAKGDLVAYQSPVIDVHAGYGRIREWEVNGSDEITDIILDNSVPLFLEADVFTVTDFFTVENVFTMGITTAMTAELKNGNKLTFPITGQSSRSRLVQPVTPFVAPDGWDRDVHVVVGQLGNEFKRLYVASVQPRDKFVASIRLVDEAPQVLGPTTRDLSGSGTIAITGAANLKALTNFVPTAATISVTGTAAVKPVRGLEGTATIAITGTANVVKEGDTGWSNGFSNGFS